MYTFQIPTENGIRFYLTKNIEKFGPYAHEDYPTKKVVHIVFSNSFFCEYALFDTEKERTDYINYLDKTINQFYAKEHN